jgi:hypothetical protein
MSPKGKLTTLAFNLTKEENIAVDVKWSTPGSAISLGR